MQDRAIENKAEKERTREIRSIFILKTCWQEERGMERNREEERGRQKKGEGERWI